MRKPAQSSFKQCIKTLSREGGGLLQVAVILPEERAAMAIAALAGEPQAQRFLLAVMRGQENIRALAQAKTAICLCCPAPVTDTGATQAFLMAADGATLALGTTVCEGCSAGPLAEVYKRVLLGFQEAFPGMQSVSITHPEGGQA